jgi:hypothetical protein
MTELVVVSRPRMRYLKWIGGGVYKTYLAPLTTTEVDLVKPDYSAFTSTAIPMYSGSVTRVAQQIIAPSSNLLSNLALVTAVVKLLRVGSPTGTLYVRLYSDSNNTPSSLLATIGSRDVSTISSTLAVDYMFDATSPISVTPGTKYWISVEYGGGNSTNYVNAYKDAGTDRDTSVLGASYTTAWTTEIYDRAMVAGFQADYSYGPFDFIYSGVAEQRLRITEPSGFSVTVRKLNGQSFSSAITETTIIPQADDYSLIYTVKATPTTITTAGTFSLTIQRYLYYAATSITLNQLGYSEGYIWKITFPTGTNQLQVDDNPDAVFSGTNTTMSFADAPIPFRKLEWIAGSGEVEILVVE